MKSLILTFALLFSIAITAQDHKPVFEKQGDMIKATYFHNNGKIAQIGFYKEGKVHGEWKAFDENGKKIAVAQYDLGKRTGKWFFWNGSELSEVDYSNNRIAGITKWNNADRVVVNEKE